MTAPAFRIGPQDALIVVDVQNDFCPGGALAVPDGDAVVALCNALAARFSTVVLTQDWHPAGHKSFAGSHEGRSPFEVIDMPYGPQVLWPEHCVQGSAGAAFHPELDMPAHAKTFQKGGNPEIDSYSGFLENDRRTETGLADWLKAQGIRRIFVTGLALDFCVGFTALDGIAKGLEVVVVEDATRAIDLNGSRGEMIARLKAAGVTLASTADVLGQKPAAAPRAVAGAAHRPG